MTVDMIAVVYSVYISARNILTNFSCKLAATVLQLFLQHNGSSVLFSMTTIELQLSLRTKDVHETNANGANLGKSQTLMSQPATSMLHAAREEGLVTYMHHRWASVNWKCDKYCWFQLSLNTSPSWSFFFSGCSWSVMV